MVRFDPNTGMVDMMEAMRYKDPASDTKILWMNEVLDWKAINGNIIPMVGAVTWFDNGIPWAVFTVEEAVYNVDVQAYIQANGP